MYILWFGLEWFKCLACRWSLFGCPFEGQGKLKTSHQPDLWLIPWLGQRWRWLSKWW